MNRATETPFFSLSCRPEYLSNSFFQSWSSILTHVTTKSISIFNHNIYVPYSSCLNQRYALPAYSFIAICILPVFSFLVYLIFNHFHGVCQFGCKDTQNFLNIVHRDHHFDSSNPWEDQFPVACTVFKDQGEPLRQNFKKEFD